MKFKRISVCENYIQEHERLEIIFIGCKIATQDAHIRTFKTLLHVVSDSHLLLTRRPMCGDDDLNKAIIHFINAVFA